MSVALVHHREERKQLAHLAPVDATAKLIDMWLFNKGDRTQAHYRDCVTKFLAFVAKPLPQVTLEDLYDFAAYLDGQELADSTQKTILYVIKSLISFAHKMGMIPINVGAALTFNKTPDTLNERLLSEDEVFKLICSGDTNPRNQAILKLLYCAGLRVSELCGLKWKDLNARGDSGQVTVMGKGNKVRSVLLPKSLWDEILQLRGHSEDDDPVFRSLKGGHLNRRSINKIISDAGDRSGLNKKVSPHYLRHAHASHALENGANIGLVKETLGHANVATTSRYLHARPNQSSSMYLSF